MKVLHCGVTSDKTERSRVGEQGWRSGDSACFPSMLPGFRIPELRVICGLSLLLVLAFVPRRFSPGTPLSPILKNQHF